MDSKGFTISCAESITGGALSSAITKIKGTSQYFKGGIVAYTLDIKHNLLGVDKYMAEKCNCVSEEVAKQMAFGVAEKFNSDIGVATCGYSNNPEDFTQEYITKNNINVDDLPYAYVCIYDRRKTTKDTDRYKIQYFKDENDELDPPDKIKTKFTRIAFINYISYKAYNMILNLD